MIPDDEEGGTEQASETEKEISQKEVEQKEVEGLAIPDTLPVLPLRDLVAFPMTAFPLSVGKPSSVQLVDDAMRVNRLIALVTQRDPNAEPRAPEDLYPMGTVGLIHQLSRGRDGNMRLMVQGLERVRLLDWLRTEPYLTARVEIAREPVPPGTEIEALRHAILEIFRKLVELSQELPDELGAAAETITDPRHLTYFIASLVPLDTSARQAILEIDPLAAKLRRLIDALQRELAVRELGRKITTDTEERLSKRQREFYLREQLRSIQQELGEGEGAEGDGGEGGGGGEPVAELRRKIEEAGLPEEARREAKRELDRLASMPPSSPEHGMTLTYLEWMASLPWKKTAGGAIDILRARQVLDEDHFDLEKVKDRILEYLSVKKLRQERFEARSGAAPSGTSPSTPPRDDSSGRAASPGPAGSSGPGTPGPAAPSDGGTPSPPPPVPAEPPRVTGDTPAREPILCFAGPPGVGKTSLGQSIARALGRPFVRMSLGGVRDEAEIRGHRRTYIGALPGRIIQGIRRAETRDPVFMLDEIDKVGADWRGDPSSALLEVLDPAQNESFADHYLGVPFDLSQVLFIATANTLDTIPGPLLDRMEVLRLSGYTDEEKIGIAKQFLVPKQLAAHALAAHELEFEPEAIRQIVRGYTRESGVRNLEREIAAVARKVARAIAEGRRDPVRLTPDAVAEYLGRPHFFDEAAERTSRPGVATGLAWTPVGGEVLFVEATMIPGGAGRLIITGMLGEVMRESAQAALSYLWSNALALGIPPNAFEEKTVHIHVPAGAIPKDGPSAGVTIMTALASLAAARPVRSDVAMTGEITLRGKVLPVGGVKEKVLAAHRAGIRSVILPARNDRHVEDVPEELRRVMTFHFVETAEEVLKLALTPAAEAAAGTEPGLDGEAARAQAEARGGGGIPASVEKPLTTGDESPPSSSRSEKKPASDEPAAARPRGSRAAPPTKQAAFEDDDPDAP